MTAAGLPELLSFISEGKNPTQMLFLLCFKSQRQSTTQTFKTEPQTLQIGSHFKNNSVHRHREESDAQTESMTLVAKDWGEGSGFCKMKRDLEMGGQQRKCT